MTRKDPFNSIRRALRKISPQEWLLDENSDWLDESLESARVLLRHWTDADQQVKLADINAHNAKMTLKGLQKLKAPEAHVELAHINVVNTGRALAGLTKLRDATKRDFHKAVGV